MGNWVGHAGPGTALLLFGIFAFLRALNLRSLRFLRVNRFWLFFEPGCKFAMAIVGMTIETAQMKGWAMSHGEHYKLLSVFGFIGLVDILHLKHVVRGHAWAMVSPLGFAFLGYLIASHVQEDLVKKYFHEFNGMMAYAGAFTRALEMCVSIYSVRSRPSPLELATQKRLDGSAPLYCRGQICCGGAMCAKQDVRKLNPVYTSQAVYRTPLPMLTAFFTILAGAWWWRMAQVVFCADCSYTEMETSMPVMAGMIVRENLYTVIMYVFGSCLLGAAVLQCLDRNYSGADPRRYDLYPHERIAGPDMDDLTDRSRSSSSGGSDEATHLHKLQA